MFALSSSWNTSFKISGKKIISQIKDLGFDYIELSFSHTQHQIKQIIENKDIKVISLHNYCPIPDDVPREKALPDCHSLSSLNANERKKAVKFTKRTIELASKLKAKAVVLHCGRVQIQDHTKKLLALIDKNNRSCEFDSLKELALRERGENKGKFLDSVFLSLKEVSDFAYNLGIALGIENRIYIREIPDFSEIKILLDNFSRKGIYYWHDTGHAYVLEKIGLNKHTDYLKVYRNNLLGMHLHDVIGTADHYAPFSGEINFNIFKPYIKKNTIKVIEAHKQSNKQDIIAAKEKLEKLFAG